MFYLKTLFNYFKNYPIRNGIFFVLSCLLLSFPFFEKTSLTYLEGLLPISNQGASFHALISSDVSTGRISRKIRTLPGVFQVVTLSEREIESKVQKILGAIDIDNDLLNSFGIKSNGLKVIFKKNIDTKVQLLIREYLKKLVGKSNVMLGAIANRSVSFSWTDNLQSLLRQWGSISLFGSLLFLWFIGFFMWTGKFKKEVGMLQRFQRRKNIALKSYITLVSFLIISSFFIGLITAAKFNPQLLAASFIVIVLSGLIFSPGSKWQS